MSSYCGSGNSIARLHALLFFFVPAALLWVLSAISTFYVLLQMSKIPLSMPGAPSIWLLRDQHTVPELGISMSVILSRHFNKKYLCIFFTLKKLLVDTISHLSLCGVMRTALLVRTQANSGQPEATK